MPYIIETKRLGMRPFERDDGEVFFRLNNDPEVMQYTGDIPFKSIEESERFIANYDHYQEHGYGRWTVVLKQTGTVIGWCGLKYHMEGYVDIGYRLLRSEWGNGYGTEAAQACLDFGRMHISNLPIWGRVSKDNIGSIRVLEKIGMQYFKSAECGAIQDSLYYR